MLAAEITADSIFCCGGQSHILSVMKDKLGSQFDANDVNLVSDNLLRLEVFYKEFNYEEITETPAYPVRILDAIFPLKIVYVRLSIIAFLRFI